MNTMSESRVESSATVQPQRQVLVWDVPVRVFHWLMVLCFAGAYLTSESERLRLLHVTLGYTMAGLVVFRLLWGLVGTRYARFTNFVRGPAAAAGYVKSMLHGRPQHYTGHNPAGAIAIVALLALALFVTTSGWATYNEIAGDWLEEVHEAAAATMLAIVGVHVAGVVVGSLMHRENLVRAMFSGRKQGTASEGIRSAWRTVGALMIAAVLGFWYLQWNNAPAADSTDQRPVLSQQSAGHDDD
ncbi:MAG TPA: cytochrome b/b6 domain-containing protein [Noviherbaspirillum sp.]|nr:cytochrome b/b6 domain-containing protein [Noviherbaspirillum sp.]